MEDELFTVLDSIQEEVGNLGGVFQTIRDDGRQENAVASYLEDLFIFALYAADQGTEEYPEDFLNLLSALLVYQFTQEHADMALQAFDGWKDFEHTIPYSLTLLVEDDQPRRAAIFCDVYIGIFAKFTYLFCVVMAGANPANCFEKVATMQDYCEYTLNQRGLAIAEMPWRQRMHESEECCCGHEHHHGYCDCGDDCECGGHHHGHHHGDCGCGCGCEG